MTSRFETALRDALEVWGLVPSPEQVSRMEEHFRAAARANERFNLTRVTDAVAAASGLYADSIASVVWAERVAPRTRRVLDAGTGAGFPAVPVAVMQPRWRVHAIDATRKKVEFLADTVERLGLLRNITVAHERVEHVDRPPTYELVLFKAVSQIESCLRWSQHVVSRGGYVVLYKTPDLPAEEEEAGSMACRRFGFDEAEPFCYSLPQGGDTLNRVLRVYRRGA